MPEKWFRIMSDDCQVLDGPFQSQTWVAVNDQCVVTELLETRRLGLNRSDNFSGAGNAERMMSWKPDKFAWKNSQGRYVTRLVSKQVFTVLSNDYVNSEQLGGSCPFGQLGRLVSQQLKCFSIWFCRVAGSGAASTPRTD